MAEGDFTLTEIKYSELSPEMREYLDVLTSLPEDIRSGVFKHAFRLLNNDPKVNRLSKLLDSGQISHDQFYKMM